MLKKLIDKIVSVWHDFLNWWNAIPQELMATKLMHHYEVTRFLMNITSFIAYIGVPYLFMRLHWHSLSNNDQGNIIGTFLVLFVLTIVCYLPQMVNRDLRLLFSLIRRVIFIITAAYIGGSTKADVLSNVSASIIVSLFLWFIFCGYAAFIQWLIKLSVNKDIVWTKKFIGSTKEFKQDSVWHQYKQRYRPYDTGKSVATPVQPYDIGKTVATPLNSPEYYQKMWRERLANEQQTVNSNMLVAFNAGLPYQLVQQAKELDQVGAYSLPTVKLETPWPLKYRFEIRVDYFEIMKRIPVEDVEKNFENKSN